MVRPSFRSGGKITDVNNCADLAQEISGVVFDLCGKGQKPARFT